MRGWAGLLWRPALMVAGLALAGVVMQRVGLDGVIGEAAGKQGAALFVVVATLACSLGVPRQGVAYAGGLAFGFWPGVGLALLAEMGGCAADFWWARLLGRQWAARWLAREGRVGARVARVERFLVANAFSATLTLRLLPVGSNMILNLLAGVSSVAAAPFLAASVLGYLPQTVVFALLGGGVRVDGGVQMGMAAGLMVVSVLLGVVLMRRRGVPLA